MSFGANYQVALDVFEGPLDLLLHLVRRHELDILDIPISFVAVKYLEYLDLMRSLDLEIAGDYLVMAATLAWLKSRELLPAAPRAGRDVAAPAHLHRQHGQADRDAEPPLQDLVEEAVARVLILGGVAAEALVLQEEAEQRGRLGRVLARAAQARPHLIGEAIEGAQVHRHVQIFILRLGDEERGLAEINLGLGPAGDVREQREVERQIA